MDRLEKDVLMTSETVGLFVSQICNELSHPLSFKTTWWIVALIRRLFSTLIPWFLF